MSSIIKFVSAFYFLCNKDIFYFMEKSVTFNRGIVASGRKDSRLK